MKQYPHNDLSYLITLVFICSWTLSSLIACSSQDDNYTENELSETSHNEDSESNGAGTYYDDVPAPSNNEAGTADIREETAGSIESNDLGMQSSSCINLVTDNEHDLCLDDITDPCDYNLAEEGFDCVDQDMDCYWVCETTEIPSFLIDPDDQRSYIQGDFENTRDDDWSGDSQAGSSDIENQVEDCHSEDCIDTTIQYNGVSVEWATSYNAVLTISDLSQDYEIYKLKACGQQQFVLISQEGDQYRLLYADLLNNQLRSHSQFISREVLATSDTLQIECTAQLLYLIDQQRGMIRYALIDDQLPEWEFNLIEMPNMMGGSSLIDFQLNTNESSTWIMQQPDRESVVYQWQPRFMGGNIAEELTRTTKDLARYRLESYLINNNNTMVSLELQYYRNESLQYQINDEAPILLENVNHFIHNNQWLIWQLRSNQNHFYTMPWAVSFYEDVERLGLRSEVTTMSLAGMQKVQILNFSSNFMLLKGEIDGVVQYGQYFIDSWEFNLINFEMNEDKELDYSQKMLMRYQIDEVLNQLQIFIHLL
jgi:hypothetical protein